jgi:DnaJ family protein C protein 9
VEGARVFTSRPLHFNYNNIDSSNIQSSHPSNTNHITMSKRARADDGEEEGEEDLEMLEEEMPTGVDPYAVLALDRSASQDDVKRAYRKAALKNHPDKAPEDQKAAAHTKFQEVAFAFAILSDERRRKRYDTTGSTDESLDIDDDDFNWSDFFREQFANAVTTERITDFASEWEEQREAKRNLREEQMNKHALEGSNVLPQPWD